MAAALPMGASLAAEEVPLLPRGASLAEPAGLPVGASPAPDDADTILAEMEREEQARRQVASGVKAKTPEGEHDPRAATRALALHLKGYYDVAGTEAPLEVRQLASGELPGSYAGVKTPAMRGVDILDMLTSPVARPLVFSPAAVAADFDALGRMEPAARTEWIRRLSPEDERKPLFEEAAARLDAGKGVGAGLKARLWKTYESAFSPFKKTSAADIDPYGGTGLPHPWQEVDDLGRPVPGTIPADPTDILFRGILAGGTWTGPGDPLADPARYMEMRRDLQRGGAGATALLKDLLPAGAGAGVLAASPLAGGAALAAAPVAGALGLAGMAVGGVRATRRVLREGVVPEEAEAAIAAGDTRTGLLVPELAAMVGPDLITKATPVGLAVGAARTGALRTGAGLLTKAGDELLQAQRATAHGPIVERFRAWWRSEAAAGRPPAESAPGVPAPEPTAEALSSLSRRIHEAVDAQFTRVGDEAAAQRKVVERIDLGKAIRLDVENLGADGLPRVQVDAGKVDVTYGAKRAPGGVEAWLGGQTPGLFGRRSLLGVSIERGARGLSRLSIGATKEGPRYVFAGPLERSRRLLGTGQPWAVEVAPGRFEPVKPTTILGDHRWTALKHALAKTRYGRNADKHAVDEAAFAVLWGTADRRQQQIVTRYLEVSGDVSVEGDLAARLMGRLEQEMAGIARMVPEEWIAELHRAGGRAVEGVRRATGGAGGEVVAPETRDALARLERMREATAAVRATDPGLYAPVLGVLRSETTRAQVLRGLMEDLTGFATAEQREEFLRVTDRMDQVVNEANLHLSDRAFREAVETMTVAQAKQAERAVARAGGPEAARAEWGALPDNVRAAIGTARKFFDDMYLRLKAEGVLPAGWSRAAFMERMRVEGYVSHMLRRGGGVRGAYRNWRLAQRFGVDFGALKQRKYAGTIDEINESVRRDIAMMIREHELAKRTGASNFEARRMAQTAPQLAAPADPVRALLVPDVEAAGVARSAEEHAARTQAAIDADLDRIIAEYDLGRIQFFETDAYRLMIDYGKGASAALANKRFIDHLRAIFPEGDLARLSPEGRLPLAGTTGLDVQAELAGWRRLNGSAQVEAVFADIIPWRGWKQYRSEIDAIVKNFPEGERERELDKVLRKMGADPSGKLATAVRRIVKQDVFLPAQVVETIEYFARPDPVKAFSKMAQVPLTVADDMLAFFKTGVTVGAIAFHGRNMISNALSSLMVAGPRALSPVIHAQVVGLLAASDTTKPYTMRVAGQDVTQTVGQWQDELARLGVLSYHVTLADVTKTLDQHRVRTRTGVRVAALGAAAGFASGYSEGKTPEEKVRLGFMGAFSLGMKSAAGFGVYEMFLRRGFRAGGIQATGRADPKFFSSDTWASLWAHRKEAFRAGATAIIEDMAEWAKVRPALSAGAVVGALAGVADIKAGAGVAAAAATAAKFSIAAFAVKYGGEGFFLLGGGIGQGIESQWRAANYFAGRSAGMSPDAAADLVNRALFDYDDLTPFERYGLRRVFPFWTWNSKNALQLQPWLMVNRPHTYQALDKILILATNPDPSEGDMSLLPPEQRWRFVVNTGAGRIVAGFGLPQEALIQQFRTEGLEPTALTAQLRPEVQFIEKFLVGRHPYYDVPLEQIRTGRDVRYLHPMIQRWVGYDPRIDEGGRVFHQTGHYPGQRGRRRAGDPYFIPSGEDPRLGAYRMALLQSFPAWRIAVEYNKAAATTFMRGTGEGEQGPPATALERTFALTTGVKPYGVDWDELETQMWRRFERNLMTSAEAQDLAKRFPYFQKQRDLSLRDYETLTGQGE